MAGHAGKAFWYSTNTGDFVTSTYYYDTHVPIIFMGPGIQPQTVHRRVHPVDVAPTIAALLGMTPPGSAQGSPLEEVFQ
jgi:arylsulfatase A-like enzyme